MPIHYERDDEHVVRITIDRPEAKNSADMEHFRQLRESWDRFAADPDAWVAIITGVGDAFFTGADLKRYIPEITKLQKQIADEGLTEINGYRLDDGTRAVLRNVPIYKPIIAAVNGVCVAGGMEMLMGTDLRVASEKASFGIFEPRRALFPGGGTTVRLPRQVPYCFAMEVLLTADAVAAQLAYEMGIVNRVVPHGELMATAMRFAETICKNGPLAVRAVKECVHKNLRLPLKEAFELELDYSAKVFMTEDAQEGLAAFREKRPAVWKGK
jgi:enoyl-CoA hydratase